MRLRWLRRGAGPGKGYAVVLLLLILTWMAAATGLVEVRRGLKEAVLAEAGLVMHVQAFTTTIDRQQASMQAYLSSGDRRLLDAYRKGQQGLAAEASSIGADLDDPRERTLLVAIEKDASRWQRWATAQMQLVESGRAPSVRLSTALSAGRQSFEALFADAAALQRYLARDRQADLDASDATFLSSLLFLGAIVVPAIIIVLLLARRAVRLFRQQRAAADEAQRARIETERSSQRYRTLVKTSPDAILMCNAHAIIIMANRQAALLFGFGSENDLLHRALVDLIAEEDRLCARESLSRRWSLTQPGGRATRYTFLRQDGSTFPGEASSQMLLDNASRPESLTVVIRDASEREAYEDQLRHQALHDPLTELPNRTLLLDRLEHTIAAARRTARPFAFVLLDIDRFKEINDSFGHQYGDLVLRHLASRLPEVLRESDTVARLGGDEFGFILPDAGEDGAVEAVSKISRALDDPVVAGDQTFDLDASLGVTLFPEHGEEPATLMRHAEMAMYAAKHSQSGFALYSASHDSYSPDRLALVRDLRQAVGTDQIVLYYQPKVDRRTGEAVGVEALVRWHHPVRGSIPPAQFISLAEHTGLIKPLTIWVLNQALKQCRSWIDVGMSTNVSVNLSARDLHDSRLVESIPRLLDRWQVPGRLLQVEVTESAVMDDPIRAVQILTRLRGLGVTISIDDFGTGYSSLAYLKRLPASEVKIDQSFVLDMATDDSDRRIVRATIMLAHELQLRAVAEGVEDEATLDLLARFDCDVLQGFFLSPPLPAEACTHWLQQRRWSRAS